MEPITVALCLLVVQAALGAIDTFVSHEWRERLPQQPWAARELALHALRSTLYAAIFFGLAWFEWHGLWGWAVISVMILEYIVTTIDSVVEDQTRVLAAFERTNHMLLALNTGLYLAFTLLQLGSRWQELPGAIAAAHHPLWLSLPLTASAVAAGAWAVRDALASNRQRARGRAHPGARANGSGTDKRLSASPARGSENDSSTSGGPGDLEPASAKDVAV